MKLTRRDWGGIALGGVIAVAFGRPAAADAAPPADVIKGLYDVLLDVMKNGPALGFQGRYDKLEPAIHQAFDVATMCKIAIGPSWTSLPTDKKNALLVTFDKFLVSTYAARFKSFSGEQLQVGQARPAPDDRVLVETKLVKSSGEPIQLNYLCRKNPGGWQVIDIYLAGSISQMSQMRSEFSEPLQKGGVDVLIQQLDLKIKQFQAAA